MSPEVLTIVGMTATILIATWTTNRSLATELRGEIKDFRAEVKEDIQALRAEVKEDIQALRAEVKEEIHELREAQHALDNRMAGLEGLMQGLREAIVARSVA